MKINKREALIILRWIWDMILFAGMNKGERALVARIYQAYPELKDRVNVYDAERINKSSATREGELKSGNKNHNPQTYRA